MALRRLAVLGWPVDHSRSPVMQTAALAALGLEGRFEYGRVAVAPGELEATVRDLPAQGYAGVNVTIPYKEAALGLADEASADARAIGAANTLSFGDDGAIRADNTDAPGLLDAIGAPVPRSALVLGAGGSARAAVHVLRRAGAEVAVWNRSPERARALAADLGAVAVTGAAPAEALVNCTSVGLHDPSSTFKELPVGSDDLEGYALVVDLVYRDGGTALLAEAARRGCRVVDGLEILVRQGAHSLEIWTGRSAPLDVMRRAARGEPAPVPPPTA